LPPPQLAHEVAEAAAEYFPAKQPTQELDVLLSTRANRHPFSEPPQSLRHVKDCPPETAFSLGPYDPEYWSPLPKSILAHSCMVEKVSAVKIPPKFIVTKQ